jgi:acyl-coenzyme A synthetase/AMP-(fatty) acid ligase
MSRVPLLADSSLDRIIAWRPDGPVRAGQFLGEVLALARRLSAGGHLLNLCHDRYHFAVGFAAGLVQGKLSLQPSSVSPETLRSIRATHPDLVCLCDGEGDCLDLPRLDYPEPGVPPHECGIPAIAAEQAAACLFTSGSTGEPVPHFKSWGSLARNGRGEAQRLGLLDRPHAVVGTVPVQHSYGFESTFLLALHGGCAFWSGRPFYPQDIADALKSVPRPRLLVTTPLHLAALLAAEFELPAIDMILCATAPLSPELAAAAEARCAAPLFEIYGATESGQVASRRTTQDAAWEPLPGVRLEQEGELSVACGGHIEGRVPLSDVIEIRSDGRFLLHGRHADMVNVAGKRTSLAYLDHQIRAIPGVADAAFFLPDAATATGVTRLCAFVVAPGMARSELLAALRERVEAVFLPRPLVFVDHLPRNGVGKLPRAGLSALHAEHLSRGRR